MCRLTIRKSHVFGIGRRLQVTKAVTGSEGQWELSDGERQIGHIEQVGLAFEIKPLACSILDGMEAQPNPSKQEALRAIELHTGRSCEPAVTQT
jgi:hypothetical protein